ncbi:MAG: DUF6069 family protein [Tetrasphaera sp.]
MSNKRLSTIHRQEPHASGRPAGRSWTPLAVTLGADLAAAVGWLVGRLLLGGLPLAGMNSVGLPQVVLVTTVAGLLAWLTSRFFPQTFRVLAVAVATLSLAGPLTSAKGGSAAVLVSLHIIVAGVLIVGLASRHGVEPDV